LQAPVYPQEEGASAAHSLSGSLPAWMGPQTPSAPLPFLARVHAEQVPAHAVSQQTPSAQKPLAHWSPAVQASPGLSPREKAYAAPLLLSICGAPTSIALSEIATAEPNAVLLVPSLA